MTSFNVFASTLNCDVIESSIYIFGHNSGRTKDMVISWKRTVDNIKHRLEK